MDTTGFYAPVGLTVTEQSDPYFKISYEGHECQWNGPSWPFATTQTLKALANFLNNYSNSFGSPKYDSYKPGTSCGEKRVMLWLDNNLSYIVLLNWTP